MPRSESPNRAWLLALLALSLTPLACGAGAAKELAVVRDELTKVQRDHAALYKRIGDLEARGDQKHAVLADDDVPHPVASSGSVEAGGDATKGLKVVKLEPKVVASEPTASDDEDAPRPLLKIGPSGAIEQTMPDEPSKSPGKKASLSKTPVLDPQAAKDYESAFALVKAKKHNAALEALGAFVVRYPDHPYAANALYWRGECFYTVADYTAAIGQFDALAIRFPGSPKLPDALLKLGLAHRKLGSTTRASEVFSKLKKEFPSSEAAKKIPAGDAS